ncbi:uncharacterized protein LOC101849874 [Aplysia californica]|uniref:Delta-like protein n=1 Tax=Aplysia californica TaxID=6500 RepID=A0ABM0K1J1_APLCA|nr:uncharacterized protein LOC101849874 [Aplysia californica]
MARRRGSSVQWSLLGAVTLCCMQACLGGGYIEVDFERYRHNCDEDGLFGSSCDPMFTFCLSRPRETPSINICHYGKTGESGHYQDRSEIYFDNNIRGIVNPWSVTFTTLKEPTIMLVIRTRDDDILGGDDHMATWGTNLTETIQASRSTAKWKSHSSKYFSHEMRFKIRIFCDADFYTSNCDVQCLAQDSDSGHYVCNPKNGTKICLAGWKGENCDEDINECELGYCQRGTCENSQGDYFCHCPVYYTGKNCTQMENPCDSKPCVNNATCYSSIGSVSYTCNCTEGWEGQNCQDRVSPCVSDPCLNGGTCVSSANSTVFNCTCPSDYAGDICNDTASTGGTGDTGGGKTDRQTSSEEDFPLWIIVLICILLLVILVVVIVCVAIMRRRKRKQAHANVGLPPPQTVVVFGGDNLSFENTMYNDVHRNGTSTLPANGIPPTTPSDDDLFNPVKPAFCVDSDESEEEGAVGGHHDMDVDGYVQPSKTKPSGKKGNTGESSEEPRTRLETRPNERAQNNPYADFRALGQAPEKQQQEEVHYHDLDEMAMAIKKDKFVDDDDEDFDDLSDDSDLSAPPPFGEDTVSSHYSDLPRNTPKNSLRLRSADWDSLDPPPPPPPRNDESPSYSTPVKLRDDVFPLPPPEPTYSEPRSDVRDQATPPPSLTPPTENAYADIPTNTPKPRDPFAEGIPEDDDVDVDARLPDISGYATPNSSWHRNVVALSSDGSPYDSPPNGRPSSNGSEYDSPRPSHSMGRPAPRPPITAPKPPSRSISAGKKGLAYDDVDVTTDRKFNEAPQDEENDDTASTASLPIAPPPPIGSETPPTDSQNMGIPTELGSHYRPISVREGFSLDSENFEEDVSEDAETAPETSKPAIKGLYLQNHAFSNA